MIWKSVALMTVVDLLIISAVAYSFRVFFVYRQLLAEAKPRVGLTAVVAGLLLVAAFYAADLAVMHVLPLFLAKGVAMAVMTDLHLDYLWIVTLIGVGAIAFGFAVMTRQMSDSVERLRRSEAPSTIRAMRQTSLSISSTIAALTMAWVQASRSKTL